MKLVTKRLILRKPRESDWKDLIEGAGEYDIARMTKRIPHPYSKKDAISFINHSIKKWSEKESYSFVIELKEEKKLIGAIGLGNISKLNGTATTGSWINKRYWKNGYITEAKIAVNDFAFNTLKLRRLNSTVLVGNNASNATQKKVGYVLEGVQRRGAKSAASGKISDLNMYGLLKEDWSRVRKSLIAKLKAQ